MLIDFVLKKKKMKNIICKYSGLSLSRTRKGPTDFFEIEKVRDRENCHKNQNFF